MEKQRQRVESLQRHLTTGNVKNRPWSRLGEKGPDDVVVVSALRTAIGKARRGVFKDTTPDVLLQKVLKASLDRLHLNPNEIGDVTVGNVQMGGSYAGPARMAQLVAGFPETVRFFSRQISFVLKFSNSITSIISINKGTVVLCEPSMQ